MKLNIGILIIVVLIVSGCAYKSGLEGAWSFVWNMDSNTSAPSYLHSVRSSVASGGDFNWIYYLTGKDTLDNEGSLIYDGINLGKYIIEDDNITINLNNDYAKLFDVDVREYTGKVINDELLSGEVSFSWEGKSYKVNWTAERL